jgi:XTP/dITP diphosphohydrolase
MSSALCCRRNSVRAPVKLFLASSNPGKLAEYRELAAASTTFLPVELELIEGFATLPEFAEDAPTFAENAAGKAIHYSRHAGGLVFADDSGLVVPALGGAPGVHSARYAGPGATNAQRIAKLLSAMKETKGVERAAYFVCAIALSEQGRTLAVVTNRVDGEILEAPRGSGGFGYDPVFYVAALGKTFAEIPAAVKNQLSHRGKAFQRLLAALSSML